MHGLGQPIRQLCDAVVMLSAGRGESGGLEPRPGVGIPGGEEEPEHCLHLMKSCQQHKWCVNSMAALKGRRWSYPASTLKEMLI